MRSALLAVALIVPMFLGNAVEAVFFDNRESVVITQPADSENNEIRWVVSRSKQQPAAVCITEQGLENLTLRHLSVMPIASGIACICFNDTIVCFTIGVAVAGCIPIYNYYTTGNPLRCEIYRDEISTSVCNPLADHVKAISEYTTDIPRFNPLRFRYNIVMSDGKPCSVNTIQRWFEPSSGMAGCSQAAKIGELVQNVALKVFSDKNNNTENGNQLRNLFKETFQGKATDCMGEKYSNMDIP